MSSTSPADDAAAFCANEVKQHDFDRYAATLFMPPQQRRALLALYAFNVEIVRVREQIRQPMAGEIRLQWWADMLVGAGHGYVEGSPVAAELMRAVETFALPREPLSTLIEAHRFDLFNDPMPDLGALDVYVLETTSALFGLGARIAVAAPDLIAEAMRHAGLAYGYQRVLTMLPFDASRRQLYLPLSLLAAHGSSADEVFAGRPTAALRAAIRELAEKALLHLQEMRTALKALPPQARQVFLPAALAERRLRPMTAPDFNPFVPAPDTRLRVLWTLWRASRSQDFRAR